MSPIYTDAEKAFIKASMPVHVAADDVRRAIERHTRLTNEAFQLGIDQLGDKMEDAEYVHDLLVRAAKDAGFAEDSFVVQGLHNTLQEYRGFEAAQNNLPKVELPAGVDLNNPDEGLVM